MLENISRTKTQLRACLATAQSFPGQFAHDGALKLSRSSSGTFFAAVQAVAKHFCHRLFSAQEMHLETVGLFVRARLGIDAANVFF